mgnify:FL=1
MDIMLHLGAHRCASTTFQSFLWNNRARLAKQGLTCWTPKRTRDGLMRGLMRHPALATLADEEYGQRSIGRIRIEIARLAREHQSGLLISEENMIGTMRNNLLDARLYPLLQERLRRIAPAFVGQTLKIGLCVRSYEDYWTSCVAHLLGRGTAMPSVDLLDFLTTQPRRWRDMVRDIAAVFPDAEIVVWPFERMASQPETQLNVLWDAVTVGLENDNLWHNRSGDVVYLNKIMALRGDAPIDTDPVASDTRWMPFDEDQRSVLRADYRRDIAWLKAGAEGLARYVDGWPTPATSPDRAEDIRAALPEAALLRGRNDGIEKGLGRTGAS